MITGIAPAAASTAIVPPPSPPQTSAQPIKRPTSISENLSAFFSRGPSAQDLRIIPEDKNGAASTLSASPTSSSSGSLDALRMTTGNNRLLIKRPVKTPKATTEAELEPKNKPRYPWGYIGYCIEWLQKAKSNCTSFCTKLHDALMIEPMETLGVNKKLETTLASFPSDLRAARAARVAQEARGKAVASAKDAEADLLHSEVDHPLPTGQAPDKKGWNLVRNVTVLSKVVRMFKSAKAPTTVKAEETEASLASAATDRQTGSTARKELAALSGLPYCSPADKLAINLIGCKVLLLWILCSLVWHLTPCPRFAGFILYSLVSVIYVFLGNIVFLELVTEAYLKIPVKERATRETQLALMKVGARGLWRMFWSNSHACEVMGIELDQKRFTVEKRWGKTSRNHFMFKLINGFRIVTVYFVVRFILRAVNLLYRLPVALVDDLDSHFLLVLLFTFATCKSYKLGREALLRRCTASDEPEVDEVKGVPPVDADVDNLRVQEEDHAALVLALKQECVGYAISVLQEATSELAVGEAGLGPSTMLARGLA